MHVVCSGYTIPGRSLTDSHLTRVLCLCEPLGAIGSRKRARRVVRREEAKVPVNAGDERDPMDVHDQVINQIFGSGLTLAAILSAQRVDNETAGRLHEVIERLDAAVRDLRGAAIARVLEDRERRSAESDGDVPSEWRRLLCRLSVDEVFAYAVGGHDFYRAGDHELWAHESDGLLLSARSGGPLARRDGRVFYDIESDIPLYYEDRRTDPGRDQSTDHDS